jgi:hypothetical protein
MSVGYLAIALAGSLRAERLLGVFAACTATFATAVTVGRAFPCAAAATPPTTTPTTASPTRLAVATLSTLAATIRPVLTLTSSVSRPRCQLRCRVDRTIGYILGSVEITRPSGV